MSSCFFCTTTQTNKGVVWQSSSLFAVFDYHPVSPGHTLLIPKRHVASIVYITKTEWDEMKDGINKLIALIEITDFIPVYKQFIEDKETEQSVWFCKKALRHPRINTKPDAYNHGVNDGPAAGQTVNHVHWHIIPRFKGDVDDPRGGIRYVIPQMGNYKLIR